MKRPPTHQERVRWPHYVLAVQVLVSVIAALVMSGTLGDPEMTPRKWTDLGVTVLGLMAACTGPTVIWTATTQPREHVHMPRSGPHTWTKKGWDSLSADQKLHLNLNTAICLSALVAVGLLWLLPSLTAAYAPAQTP